MLTWDSSSSAEGDVIAKDSFFPLAAQKGSSVDKASRNPRLPLAAQNGSSTERESTKPPLLCGLSPNSPSFRLPRATQKGSSADSDSNRPRLVSEFWAQWRAGYSPQFIHAGSLRDVNSSGLRLWRDSSRPSPADLSPRSAQSGSSASVDFNSLQVSRGSSLLCKSDFLPRAAQKGSSTDNDCRKPRTFLESSMADLRPREDQQSLFPERDFGTTYLCRRPSANLKLLLFPLGAQNGSSVDSRKPFSVSRLLKTRESFSSCMRSWIRRVEAHNDCPYSEANGKSYCRRPLVTQKGSSSFGLPSGDSSCSSRLSRRTNRGSSAYRGWLRFILTSASTVVWNTAVVSVVLSARYCSYCASMKVWGTALLEFRVKTNLKWRRVYLCCSVGLATFP